MEINDYIMSPLSYPPVSGLSLASFQAGMLHGSKIVYSILLNRSGLLDPTIKLTFGCDRRMWVKKSIIVAERSLITEANRYATSHNIKIVCMRGYIEQQHISTSTLT